MLKDAVKKGKITTALQPIFPFEKQNFGNDIVDDSTFDRRHLLLNSHDLLQSNFPLPMAGSVGFQDPDFQFTKKNYKGVSIFPIFALSF